MTTRLLYYIFKGELQGRAKGELLGKQAVAKVALREEVAPEFVAKITGFSLDEIIKLKGEFSGSEGKEKG